MFLILPIDNTLVGAYLAQSGLFLIFLLGSQLLFEYNNLIISDLLFENSVSKADGR